MHNDMRTQPSVGACPMREWALGTLRRKTKTRTEVQANEGN
jgi:hypothetical protein